MSELERRALQRAALPAAAGFAVTFGAAMAITLFLATGGLSGSRDLPGAWLDAPAPDYTTHDVAERAPRARRARAARAETLVIANETNLQLLPNPDVDSAVDESIDALLWRHERNDSVVAPDTPSESEDVELVEEEAEPLLPPEAADPALTQP